MYSQPAAPRPGLAPTTSVIPAASAPPNGPHMATAPLPFGKLSPAGLQQLQQPSSAPPVSAIGQPSLNFQPPHSASGISPAGASAFGYPPQPVRFPGGFLPPAPGGIGAVRPTPAGASMVGVGTRPVVHNPSQQQQRVPPVTSNGFGVGAAAAARPPAVLGPPGAVPHSASSMMFQPGLGAAAASGPPGLPPQPPASHLQPRPQMPLSTVPAPPSMAGSATPGSNVGVPTGLFLPHQRPQQLPSGPPAPMFPPTRPTGPMQPPTAPPRLVSPASSYPAPSSVGAPFPGSMAPAAGGVPSSVSMAPPASIAQIPAANIPRSTHVGPPSASMTPYPSSMAPSSLAPPAASMAPPLASMAPPAGYASPPPPMSMQNGSMPPSAPSAASSMSRRYPQMQYPAAGGAAPGPAPPPAHGPYNGNSISSSMSQMSLAAQPPTAGAPRSVVAAGFNSMWGTETVDLMKHRHILPPTALETPRIQLQQDHLNRANCSPDLFRCTLTRIPETASVLQKSRLPFGVVIHPFKDMLALSVVQCSTIVRCRSCRTYINPFVYFIDQRRWKCNLCYRANDLPEEFQYDPVSKTYGDPSRRPECKSATVEFIAPSEYMVRPPQPACYMFVLDVSHSAVETGYLRSFCDTLLDELDQLPGDSRTLIGFITYDKCVHFYNLAEGNTQPQMNIIGDVNDMFVPSPDGLLVNLTESRELVTDLLLQLPSWFSSSNSTHAAYGAALQAAHKLVYPVGGRVTSFVASLPSHGPGALSSREDPNNRAGHDVAHLGPATDFYKKLSLECSSQQVSVDVFCLATGYADLATLAGVSQFSGGSVHHYPSLHHVHHPAQVEAFERGLRRYLTRKIGYESVMRIRCTRGMAMHAFHGNAFVRSTDLLALANVNPDAGFGMQVSVEESLSDTHTACFQAALLYTTSKGERRIRVHTLCLPVSPNIHEIIQSADQETIISLLAKMAVDRCLTSSLADAREALVNAAVDALSAYRATLSSPGCGLEAPLSLRMLPLFVLALLKHPALRSGTSTKLDDRSFAMLQLKNLPLNQLMLYVYPNLYAVHLLNDENAIEQDGLSVPQPPRLHLSAEFVDTSGTYLLDCQHAIYILVGAQTPPDYVSRVFGHDSVQQMPSEMFELPDLETDESLRLRNFVAYLQASRPFAAALYIFRDSSKLRHLFFGGLVEDRSESSYSYVEFLQHLRGKVR